jgi:hypothetical protein
MDNMNKLKDELTKWLAENNCDGRQVGYLMGLFMKHRQCALPPVGNQRELLISELAKAKALTEHLTQEERNEYFDVAIRNL